MNKFNAYLLGACLMVCLIIGNSVGSANAADQTVDLSSGYASFIGTAPILSGGQDILSFTNLATGLYNFDFTMSSQFANISTVFVNSQLSQQTSLGSFRFFGLSSVDSSPFTVTINGTALSGALYSGELQVSRASVPEPTTFLLMFLGMVLALVAVRYSTV